MFEACECDACFYRLFNLGLETNQMSVDNKEVIRRLKIEIQRLENLPAPESFLIAVNRRDCISKLNSQISELETNQ